MGCNYYAIMPGCGKACEHCAEAREIHLGKSSAGWVFLFRAQENWSDTAALDEWLGILDKSESIRDEYGATVTKEDLFCKIISKQQAPNRRSSKLGAREGYPSDSDFVCAGFEFCKREFS